MTGREMPGGAAPMTPDQWARVEELFARAVQLPAAERTALLLRECASDAELQREVESLLANHYAEPGFLDDPAWAGATEVEGAPPERVGSYLILQTLGRGGMGQVYLAEREAPGFRQQVAIKLIRRGMDTDDLIRRFRAERQILATLDHPNIARLLDVGATDAGLPYLVMEYVDGMPLLAYCDQRRLDLPTRLALFTAVCGAVQHAHRHLIVHRDLKPQNILVTRDGVPKLMDFGIAKVLDPDWEEAPARTRTELRLLTPAYSAPEQLRGEPVTTATDVYGLGMLLYELLSGRHPFARDDTGETAPPRRPETTPPPPSAVADAAAALARGATRAQLGSSLAGDLDVIVLTAMRVEPEARYPSALALAEDVRRHLDGRPINARPPTTLYRARKFLRRNPVATAAAVAMLLLLTAATAVTLHQSRLLEAESLRVSRERDKAVQVRSFLLEMFGTTGPDQPTGDSVTARQLLDRRAAWLASDASGDAELRSDMAHVLAEGYEKLGLLDDADRQARDALATRRTLFGDEHPDIVASLNQVGWVLHQQRRMDEAEATLREAVAMARRIPAVRGGAALARALNDLGVVREARRDMEEAASLYRESLDVRRRAGGGQDVGVATTYSNLAVVLYRSGELDAATAMADTALQRFRTVLGPDHPRSMIVQNNLAAMKSALGDREGAASQHRDLLERRSRLLGANHPLAAFSMSMLGSELLHLGDYGEAESLLRAAAAIQRSAPGAARDNLASTLRVLGDVQDTTGRHAEALQSYGAAFELLRQVHGTDHPDVAITRARIAKAHEHIGDTASAAAVMREAVASITRVAGDSDARTLRLRLDLVDLLGRVGRLDEARRQLQPVLRADSTAPGTLPPAVAERLHRATARLALPPGG